MVLVAVGKQVARYRAWQVGEDSSHHRRKYHRELFMTPRQIGVEALHPAHRCSRNVLDGVVLAVGAEMFSG